MVDHSTHDKHEIHEIFVSKLAKRSAISLQVFKLLFHFSSFPEIFNASGGQEMVAKFGDWFSYENTPRAKIFRRDHSRVTDIESMTRLMRFVVPMFHLLLYVQNVIFLFCHLALCVQYKTHTKVKEITFYFVIMKCALH